MNIVKIYFGYISYAYLISFLIPLYFIYRDTSFSFRKLEVTLASFLMIFSFLLAQSLLIDNELRGKIGADFADFLAPYIGLFGLWTFWFIITSVSTLIL